ncbi:hypothetical protein CTI12_AA340050 [Artemisia annua]|uniref:Uncharacterized protein n=1 Tax=Artemisia annua TaxID=35608 RepID=A0A2U1MUQ6_ARTAN|nr:hypothetical protein CTI12_AA340050 [Artemisia annua]
MAPQTLLAKVGIEVKSTENERLLGKKGRPSTPMLQQSCHYQYVPQHPIVHLVAPGSTTDCCKSRSISSSSVVVGS